jgi:hypothetical protein
MSSIVKKGRKSNLLKDVINNNIEDIPDAVCKIINKRGRKSKSNILDNINNMNDNINIINIENNKFVKFDNGFENNNTDIDKEEVENIDKPKLWLDKYKPKKISEIIGNKEEINKLREWLVNYNTSKYHTVIITGSHGIGKNIIVDLVLKDLNYQIKNINTTILKNKNIIFELIHSCTKVKNVYDYLNKKEKIKYAIVINDTESISLLSEKENILELFRLNTENKYFPIIFISNLQHSKLINNFKKMSLNINLVKPSIDEIKEYIKYICNNESIQIEDDRTYNNIILFSQYDIRRLLYILQDLYYTYNDKIITYKMFKEFKELSQKKNIDIELYSIAKQLLNKYKNINNCLELYESEKVLLPLTIYENYYKKIFKQKLNDKLLLSIMAEVSESVSIGNDIETNIYAEQNWYLQMIHGYYTCVNPSYIINKHNNKSNEHINYDVVFSADINKTSSKNINKKKNIYSLQLKFKNKCIDDILYINKIFYELNKTKKTDILEEIKNEYNLEDKNINIALKIDKTK